MSRTDGAIGARSEASRSLLLEREDELAQLDAAVTSMQAGAGGLMAVAGPAGAGKTALLEAFGTRAATISARVCAACATELEQAFAFGVARQLLAAPLAAHPERQRAALLDGAAQPAAAVLGYAGEATPPPASAALQGLTELLSALATTRPTVLLVDDAQWLDPSTLRWLDYLRNRVGALPVLVVLALREAGDGSALRPLLADSRIDVLRLAPLSEAAVTTLLGAQLDRAPAPALAAGCWRASAGNPFAVRELIASLAANGEVADDVTPEQLVARVPETIARSVLGRLARLDDAAVDLARALAVLGDGAPLRRAAALAGVPHARGERAADALVAADLAAPQRPLAFVHPLVRSTIEDDIPHGARGLLHARAAEQIAADDGDPEAVAAHLLRSDPADVAQHVRWLRRAAAVARMRGAPETAVLYLRRAHAEPPPAAERVAVLHELGQAELLARDPVGIARLQTALARTEDPIARARIGVDLFDGMVFAGSWPEGLQLARGLRDALADRDHELALALETRIAAGLLERAPAADDPELTALEALASYDPAARPLLLLLALLLALRGERCDEVPALVARGLDDGRFLATHGADSMLAVHGVDALVFVDALEPAHELAEAICADAAARGLVLGAVAGATHRGLVALRRGALAAAERDLRGALATAREHELAFTLPFITAYLALTRIEEGDLDEAAELVATAPGAPLRANRPAAATLLEARGSVHLARGERAAAVAELRACGTIADGMGAHSPLVQPWRSRLALALAPDEPEEARALVARELELARHAGIARGVAVALQARAALERGATAVTSLEEAVALLADSPATLVRAHALADLGAALRRSGRVHDSRVRLREALDQAQRLGAVPLAERATAELRAAGARPRRPWLAGVESLTPSELRVARLAAERLTNREIATRLVITTGTVKDHLSSAYRKLAISSRSELDDALRRAGSAPLEAVRHEPGSR